MHQLRPTLPTKVSGSRDLYLAVRAAFILRGTTLNEWCKANGLNRQTVEKALKGERYGRRAEAILSS